jgi:hypothetical protein
VCHAAASTGSRAAHRQHTEAISSVTLPAQTAPRSAELDLEKARWGMLHLLQCMTRQELRTLPDIIEGLPHVS